MATMIQTTHAQNGTVVRGRDLPTLDEYIKSRMTGDAFQMYNASMAMAVQSTDKYPINFNVLVEWLGVTKGNLGRLLEENLRENDDYLFFSVMKKKPKVVDQLVATCSQ